MPTIISMPAFSSTMESGKLINWLVQEGDEVKAGQALAEVETDKAVAEIEAISDGRVGKILITDTDTDIPVNEPMCVILAEGESRDDLPELSVSDKTAGSDRPAPDEQKQEPGKPKKKSDSVKSSPGAKRAAQAAGIDISLVPGTGPKGRITKEDVENYLAGNEGAAGGASAEAIIELSPMRRAIASRLSESKSTIPHFYLEITIELDNLLDLSSSQGQPGDSNKISLNTYFLKAASLAIKQVPEVNVSWNQDHIVRNDACNVGIAVAREDGLVVPVLSDVDKKDLPTLEKEAGGLIDTARSGNLPQTRIGGASITLSNLGMYNIDRFYAIINPPESGILALGTCRKQPVVVNEDIVIRNTMSCCLSADHRLLDGALAARFLNAYKSFLENPDTWTD